jgi:hypothetical protein
MGAVVVADELKACYFEDAPISVRPRLMTTYF